MKRGHHFDAKGFEDEGEGGEHPAKMWRGAKPNPSSCETAAVMVIGSGIGSGPRRNVSSDSDGSCGFSSGCNSGVNPRTLTLEGADTDMKVAALAFEGEGRCRVCLWPRGSSQCYH